MGKNYSDLKNNRIIYLDNMRAIAIVMVVGEHSMAFCQVLSNDTKEVIKFIFQICVPVFFLVDGYLFARLNCVFKRFDYLTYIQRSAIRLLLPWLIFVTGYSGLRYLFERNGYLTETLILNQPFYEVVRNSYGSVFAAQLYFLVALFLIRLTSPLTRQLLLTKKQISLFISFLLIAVYYATLDLITPYLRIPNGQEPVLHALWGFQYYLIGINLFQFEDHLKDKTAFITSISLLCITFTIHNTFITSFFIERSIQYCYLLSFYFAFRIKIFTDPLISSIGKSTMGIYLLHAPPLLNLISLITNQFIQYPLTLYFTITFVTFTVSYLITMAINKLPYGSLLFGCPTKNR